MKRLLLFICVAFMAFATKAQTSLLATLSHNGEITTFYSVTALSEAHKAAQDGDVITLSGGKFNPITVTKNVIIRGAGMSGINPTVISTLSIKPASEEGTVTLEGLYVNETLRCQNAGKNTKLVKCKIRDFEALTSSSTFPSTNFKAIQCVFLNSYRVDGIGATVVNSYIKGSGQLMKNATYENCLLDISTNIISIENSYLINCILVDPRESATASSHFGKSTIAMGCYYIGPHQEMFKQMTNDTNKSFPVGTKFLKEDTNIYELLDELKSTWIGIDGTQVGMHGGNLSFDPETTTPKIKKFEVSSKTSVDGKLSIGLEIDAN